MSANKTLNVTLVGRGDVVLRPTDHIATGGEGSVYRLGSTVVKIFTDPLKMSRDNMADKIKLLSEIKHPYINAPQNIVTDSRGRAVGYYMPYADGEGLPLFFTNAHRTQVGFGDDDASNLVDRMREAVQVVHDHAAIIVDCNEYGWVTSFVSGKKPEPHMLDVDSVAIGSWKPSVIMPSVRDYHTKGFNTLSDWFSWGVVTFQVYTGIHPYKGMLDGFDKHDFTERMKKKASVFAPGVRLNRSVRDFKCVPKRLLDWYVGEFQNGLRSKPPSPFDTGVSTTPSIVTKRVSVTGATGAVIFDRLTRLSAADKAVKVFFSGAVLLASNKLINIGANSELICTVATKDCEVVKTDAGWLIVEKHPDRIDCFYSDGKGGKDKLNLTLAARAIFRYQNRIFAVMADSIAELVLEKFAKPVLAIGTSWQALSSSTKWFDGVGVQDALGATYLMAPYSTGKLAYVRTRELDGHHVITGRAGNRFVTIIAADKKGDLHRFEFTFDSEYGSYELVQSDAETPELVLAILPKGVAATVLKDGELKIIVPTQKRERAVPDSSIVTDEPLFAWEDVVVLIRDGNVWRLKVA